MKLELKHLAPYLPYGLNTKYRLGDVMNHVTDKRKDEIRDKRLTDQNVDFVLLYCKPILRPLSDLKKLIDSKEPDVTFLDWIVSEYDFDYERFVSTLGIERLPYEVVEYLFEHHFDVFGLIEKGLAIDINTL